MKEFIEKLIARLEEESNFFGGEPMGSLQKMYYCKGVEKSIEIVNELAEGVAKNAITNGWILCSERLPEEQEDVLVWFEYFRYGEYNGLYQRMGISYTFRGDWSGFVNGQSGWNKLKIIAWQPLPQPYQPKGENNG